MRTLRYKKLIFQNFEIHSLFFLQLLNPRESTLQFYFYYIGITFQKKKKTVVPNIQTPSPSIGISRVVYPNRTPNLLPTNWTLWRQVAFHRECTALATDQMPTGNKRRSPPPRQTDHTQLPIWNISCFVILWTLWINICTSEVLLLGPLLLSPLLPLIPIPGTNTV